MTTLSFDIRFVTMIFNNMPFIIILTLSEVLSNLAKG